MRDGAAKTPCVYTIPAGRPFADTLAAGLLHEAGGDPAALSRIHIFLPTRRAARILRESVLRLSDGAPVMLPRLHTLGDVDEDSLSIEAIAAGSAIGDDLFALPPAMPKLRRQMLLARQIMGWTDRVHGPEQAMALAAALARFIDQCHTEGLSLDDLHNIVPADFSAHWNLTLDFLKIIRQTWPEILAAHGMIDEAARRDRLIRLLTARWAERPPEHRIIAAGSTGSIPATGALLHVISTLPDGSVILPGLDPDMDDASWDQMDNTHPQATMKALLSRMGAARQSVPIWPSAPAEDPVAARERRARLWLAREMMRPAGTAQEWTRLSPAEAGDGLADTLSRIRRIDADTKQEEAVAIAAALREILEDPDRTAAIITPDRYLARRIGMIAERWGIVLNDSAGQPLTSTPVGLLLRLIARAAAQNHSPAALMAVLKHGLVRLDHAGDPRVRGMVRTMEEFYLRGPAPAPGWGGMDRHIARKARAHKDRTGRDAPDVDPLLRALREAFAPLDALVAQNTPQPFAAWLDAHIETAEKISTANLLWQQDDGMEAARFLADLRDEAATLPPMDAADYTEVLSGMMGAITVRPAYGTHPRLSILGQMEARMTQADCIVLAGLNEGTWPADPGHDPWMSRPMRAQFGLPPSDRSTGLAAHDFVSGFCARDIIITRARRDGGAPTVPSRWLQRMDTVLRAIHIAPESLHDHPALSRAHLLADDGMRVTPAPPPAPAPAVTRRPHTLPVTDIDTWRRDPYAIYAKRILRLRPLDMMEKPADAALRGTLIHAVFEHFIRAHPGDLPADIAGTILNIARDQIAASETDTSTIDLWWPRLEEAAAWFAEYESGRRAGGHRPWASEASGSTTIMRADGRVFTLTAKADRIDRNSIDGTATIVDYKTGKAPTKSAMENGNAPQLPLEGMILDNGGFSGCGPEPAPRATGALHALELSGKEKPKPTMLDLPDSAITEAARILETLIDTYNDPAQPYLSLPDPGKAPRYRDYDHLARVQEWIVLGDSDDDQTEDAA